MSDPIIDVHTRRYKSERRLLLYILNQLFVNLAHACGDLILALLIPDHVLQLRIVLCQANTLNHLAIDDKLLQNNEPSRVEMSQPEHHATLNHGDRI